MGKYQDSETTSLANKKNIKNKFEQQKLSVILAANCCAIVTITT